MDCGFSSELQDGAFRARRRIISIIYRLPFSSNQDRWTTYFGAGIGFNLIHQNFEAEQDGQRIDFGDFHSDTALNILGGVRRRGGMFLELKTSVYSGPSPTMTMTVGYTF